MLTAIFGDKTYSVSNFISGVIIVYVTLFSPRVSAFFSGRLFVYLGKVSFSAYLIQVPVIATAGIYAFQRVYIQTGNYDIAAFVASVISIVLVYLFAEVFYRYVDRGGIRISSMLARRVKTIRVATVSASI